MGDRLESHKTAIEYFAFHAGAMSNNKEVEFKGSSDFRVKLNFYQERFD
jgi:hypothetical protein